MTGIPFIVELFTNVFKASKVINGKFFLSPMWGSGINSDSMETLNDQVDLGVKEVHDNMVVMMPPVLFPDAQADKATKKDYQFALLFLTMSDTNSDRMPKHPRTDIPNKNERLVMADWNKMETCAVDFIKVVDKIVRERNLGNIFRFTGKKETKIEYVTSVAKAKYNGVVLIVHFTVLTGCDLEDYEDININNITIPNQ